MTIQQISVTHHRGLPLEDYCLEFVTASGTRYRLTHCDMVDARPTWLHGYRDEDGARFFTSRTPDELTPGWRLTP